MTFTGFPNNLCENWELLCIFGGIFGLWKPPVTKSPEQALHQKGLHSCSFPVEIWLRVVLNWNRCWHSCYLRQHHQKKDVRMDQRGACCRSQEGMKYQWSRLSNPGLYHGLAGRTVQSGAAV